MGVAGVVGAAAAAAGALRMVRVLVTGAAVAAVAIGCGSGGDGGVAQAGAVRVVDAYAAEPVTSDVGAVYLTILNAASVPDTLVAAHTPIALMTHLHRMGGPGVARMRTQDVVEVPAGGQLQLRPGGLHLMLMTLTSRPRAGDTIDLQLELRHAGVVRVRVPVVSYLEVGERAAVGNAPHSP